MTQSDNPLPHAAQSSTPARFSPTAGRRAQDDAVLTLHDHTSSLAAAVARAVVVPPGHPTDTLSLRCSRRPSASRAAIDATPVCRERARMREKWRAGCGAHRRNDLDHSCRPCCLAKNLLTCPCALSGPKRQKSSEKGRRAARARRAAPAVTRPYRRLGPSEQPSRRPPIAPVVGLDRFCIAVL